MEITEIVLLVAGGIIFILSFLIPDKKGEVSEQSRELVQEEIADMVSREMESIRGHVDGVVEEAVTYAIEKTERSLERLSNEKIMAVNEYSDTVLSEIHKNHEEAMFLYDMLNSKHTNLKDTVAAVNRTVKEVEEKVNSLKAVTNMSGNPQVIAREFHPVAVQMANTVQSAPVAVQQITQNANTVPSALERLASIAAPKQKPTPVQTAPVPVPVKPTSVQAVPMPVPVIPTPVQAVPMPVSVVPTPVQAATMSASTVPVSAGRVSFLQDKAVDGQNNNEKILELYRNGKSKVAIAKELGLGVGEVKLVIDLFRNQ